MLDPKQWAVFSALSAIVTVLVGGLASDDWASGLAAGQFVLSLLLLPFLVVELSLSLAQPRLHLGWPGDSTDPEPSRTTGWRPTVYNNGNAVERWYLVRVTLPRVPGARWEFSEILGTEDNWRNAFSGPHDLSLLTFISNGQWASMPDDGGLALGDLRLLHRTDGSVARTVTLPWSIVTPTGTHRGELALQL